jgi:mannitol 2-dehydrogenase
VTLDPSTLGEIDRRGVVVPHYDRAALAPAIVHVGVGGFHRSHMALYTDEVAALDATWGIRGVGLLADDARMAAVLSAQHGLYTLIERSTESTATRVIGSLIDYRHAQDDLVLAATIADPDVAVLSLTVTESGYAEPSADRPRTTFDRLAGALDVRRVGGGAPLTVLSCDNLPGNGDVTRRAVLAAAERHSSHLVSWIERNCTFPNSMVDRITPATADTDRGWLLDTFGVVDGWPVVAESFRQWVIEDHFAAGRPDWERVGALFTSDVHAWELYKLRMLNAAHSCMAYLAALDGLTFVDEAMTRPEIRGFLDELLFEEAIPTLNPIAGHPREDYARTVLARFSNTAVRDQVARLCMDGTAKFPTFLIPTLVRQLELGGPIRCATLALAGWARYLATVPAEQQAFDPSGDVARRFARSAMGEPSAFLDLDAVFPPDLRNNERFRDEFGRAFSALARGVPWVRDSAR